MSFVSLFLVVVVLNATILLVQPLKKEVLNLPPIIHFTDVFKTEKENNHENDKTIGLLGSNSGTSNWQNSLQSQQQHQGQWWSGQHGYQSGYPSQTGYPIQEWQSQYGYPQTGYQQYGNIGYPYMCYHPHHNHGWYPHRPHFNRRQDVDVVERYFKFNDDGSKEYKLVLNNGLNIYQKIKTKKGDKGSIEMLEGYYSDQRDDGTFMTTYVRADENGYDASSEISDSPPTFPNTEEMIRVPETEENKKHKK